MPNILEKVSFRLNATATEADLQDALNKAQGWIQAQKGFQYSTVSVDGPDIMHLVFWETALDAKAAQTAFPKAVDTADLMAVIDKETFQMSEAPVIHAFGPACAPAEPEMA